MHLGLFHLSVMVLVHSAHTGLMPRTCLIVCKCEPRYDCHRRLDEWLDWRDLLTWLITDGPGRIAQTDHHAVYRAYIKYYGDIESE